MSPSHRHLDEKHSLSISKQTYLNKEFNRLGMSTLQGTFSSMRISDQDALNLSPFSVSFVISIHFSTYSKGDSPVARHGITLKRYLTWNPDVFPGQSLQKTSPPSLYFKMILHPVSVFLRNYFFLLTASGQKLFRKKTLQTAHGRFKISQIRRLTFHLTSLIFRPRCNLGRQFSELIHYPRRFCLSYVNNY